MRRPGAPEMGLGLDMACFSAKVALAYRLINERFRVLFALADWLRVRSIPSHRGCDINLLSYSIVRQAAMLLEDDGLAHSRARHEARTQDNHHRQHFGDRDAKVKHASHRKIKQQVTTLKKSFYQQTGNLQYKKQLNHNVGKDSASNS